MNPLRTTATFFAVFLCFRFVSAQAVVPADREGLLKGEGIGMAVLAEANGFPGPKHVLELKEQLGMSADQTMKARTLFERVKASGVAKGEEIVKAEEALFRAFKDGSIADETLEQKILEIAKLRGELRFVHLRAHLLMALVLTSGQVKRYNELRNHAPKH